jgi:hypothetical protein
MFWQSPIFDRRDGSRPRPNPCLKTSIILWDTLKGKTGKDLQASGETVEDGVRGSICVSPGNTVLVSDAVVVEVMVIEGVRVDGARVVVDVPHAPRTNINVTISRYFFMDISDLQSPAPPARLISLHPQVSGGWHY